MQDNESFLAHSDKIYSFENITILLCLCYHNQHRYNKVHLTGHRQGPLLLIDRGLVEDLVESKSSTRT